MDKHIAAGANIDCQSRLKILRKFRAFFDADYKEFLNVPLIPEESLYIFPKGKDIQKPDDLIEDLFSELESLLRTTSSNSISSIVILGSGGSGKSSMALEFCARVWKNHRIWTTGNKNENDGRIEVTVPIYINLPDILRDASYHNNLLKAYIYRKLSKLCKDQQMARMLSKLLEYNLLLILDGFNEVNIPANLWNLNGWNNYKIQCIYFSRPDAFKTKREVVEIFKCGLVPSRMFYLEPFDVDQVKSYIFSFVKYLNQLNNCTTEDLVRRIRDSSIWPMTLEYVKGTTWIENEEEYCKWLLQKIPSLCELAKTPFLLLVILQVLPVIVAKAEISTSADADGAAVDDKLRRIICRTEVEVFDALVKCWFEFAATRIITINLSDNFELVQIGLTDLVKYYEVYSQNLGVHLVERNKGFLTDPLLLIREDETLQAHLTEPLHYPELRNKRHQEHFRVFPSCHEDDNQEAPDRVKEARKKRQRTNLIELRNGSLLKYSQDTKTFQFLHHSLVEYFAARDLFQGLRAELNYFLMQDMTECPSKVLKFNTMPIQDFGPQIFRQIVNRAKTAVDFANCLFEVVESSKSLSILGQMAANAATVLNFAGRSLSGLDWTEVQIPGANLNQANCANTDFSGGNLSGVTFHNSFLPHCKFKGTNLHGTSFGQFPPLQLHTGFKASKLIQNLASYQGNDGYEYIFYSQDLLIYKAKIGSNDPPLCFENPNFNSYAVCMENATSSYNPDPFSFLNFFLVLDKVIARITDNSNINVRGMIWIWCAITGKLLKEIDSMKIEIQGNNDFDILTKFEANIICGDELFKISIWSFEDILIYRSRCICIDTAAGSYHDVYHKNTSQDIYIFPWISRAYFASISHSTTQSEFRILSTSPQGKIAIRFKTHVSIFEAGRKAWGLELPILNQEREARNLELVFSPNEKYLAYSDKSKQFGLLNLNSAVGISPISFKVIGRISPSKLLFSNNETRLIASFPNTMKLAILDIPSCQILNVINQYINEGLSFRSNLPNFCFCKGDEFVAFVSASGETNGAKADCAVTITKLEEGVEEERTNRQSWIEAIAVSPDSKYIAFSMSHDFNQQNRSNLEIHSTPVVPSQSLISEAKVEQIRSNSSSFVLNFSKDAIPRLLVFLYRGILVVLNMNCDILTTADLVDTSPSPLEVQAILKEPTSKLNWKFKEFRAMQAKVLKIDFWFSNTTNKFTMFWENKILNTTYEVLDESPFIVFEQGAQETSLQRSDCFTGPPTFVVWNNCIICRKNDRKGFLILHVPTKIIKRIDLELDEIVGEFTVFKDECNKDLHFLICYAIEGGGTLHFISVCPTASEITYEKQNDSYEIDSVGCFHLHKPASQPFLFVIYRNGKLECRNSADLNMVIFSINIWFPPVFVITRELEPNATDLYLYVTGGDGSMVSLLVKSSKQWMMEWCSEPCNKLIASQCHLGNSYELDMYSQVLLKGLDAQGKPFPRLEKARSSRTVIRYSSLAELLKGFPDEERAESMIPIIIAKEDRGKKKNEELDPDNMQMISSSQWSVSCVVRKQRSKRMLTFRFPHMALILEGVLHYRRFGVRFDLIYDRLQAGINREVCILAQRESLKSLKKISLHKHFSIQQFLISSESGWKLLKEIRQDMQDPIGRNIAEYNLRNRNCKSWVKDKLKSIGIKLKEHWFDKLVDLPS